MDDESSRRTRRSRGRELVREWWWAALPAMVVISVAVSGISGRTATDDARVVTRSVHGTYPVDASPPIVVAEAHRLPVGHLRPIPFDFDACVAARTDVSPKREAERYCLALAHLHISTPFS
ncbi:MAG: hypothetical protein ACXVPR_08915 [Actinomycetota bacterium]